MMKSGGNLLEVQDNMPNLYRRLKSLQEVISVLESGFEAINDDNCTYVISSFKVIEEQLIAMRSELLNSIDALASIIEAKGV